MKKNEKLFDAIGEIDEELIKEAEPKRNKPKKHRGLIVGIAIAASVSLVFAPILYFIIGMTSIERYADSPYYSLIRKIDIYKNKQKESNKWFGSGDMTNGSDEMLPESGSDGGIGGYKEVTDNQTEGVIEGDKIKRTDKYIYHLNGLVLSVYSIDGEASACLGSYDIEKESLLNYRTNDKNSAELYLFADEGVVTVVTSGIDSQYKEKVALMSFDVTDPKNIKRVGYSLLDGIYISSRVTDGKILLLWEYKFNYKNVDFDNLNTFIPSVKTEKGISFIPADMIMSPDELTSTRYTVASAFDTKTLEPEGYGAFLSYSDTVYVSENNVFATRTYYQQTRSGDKVKNTAKTDISVMNYAGEDFRVMGTVSLDGIVGDRFWLDEYDGMLRVAATVSEFEYIEYNSSNGSSSATNFKNTANASLYIYDIQSLELLWADICFAPQGETVRSARFDKTEAYVCTSIEFTDPVFVFDLSDIQNVTRKDTGTISGFSTSLIKFGEYLVGIGRESFSDMKVEVYEQMSDAVISLDSYVREYCYYPTEYKCYYINREESLLGVCINDYNENMSRYILLHFNGYKLVELADVAVNAFDVETVRGVCIDGYLYVLSNKLDVIKIV